MDIHKVILIRTRERVHNCPYSKCDCCHVIIHHQHFYSYRLVSIDVLLVFVVCLFFLVLLRSVIVRSFVFVSSVFVRVQKSILVWFHTEGSTMRILP